jgi:small subunit ribosomal protein S19e|tara:strand:+ start:11502 stop:12125 length:624 start_codon:yes stop_codon:yes gene_type:complete
MGTIYNCDPSELIDNASEELKKVESIKPTAWAAFVKTGVSKQRPPAKDDWWYARTASVLRRIYRYGPIGVSKLRTKYGSKKNRGVKPESFFKSSGNIIRKILQQLETAGFVKKGNVGVHKGRMITAAGKKFLDDVASKISKVPEKKAKEPKKEDKEKPKDKESSSKETKEVKKEAKKEAQEKKPEQKAPIETKEEKKESQEKNSNKK